MISSILLIIVFTLFNAVFASAEIAVISMKETRLKQLAEKGNKRAEKLYSLIEQPSRFLATIQVAITLSGYLNSAFASDNFSGMIVDALLAAGVPIPEKTLNYIAVFVVTAVLSYISIVLGELVPKRIAMKHSEALSLKLAPTLYGISHLFAPIVSLLTFSSNLLLRLLGMNASDDEEQVTKEEIQMMLVEGRDQGVIDKQENEFIQNVFDFNDIPAESLCTHRSEVAVIDIEDDPKEWMETIYNNRHSIYPVCRESRENILGILDVKDFFRAEKPRTKQELEKLLRTPIFVPENMRASKLLQEMKSSRNYFSILLNEYGEMTGIATLHDLVEELVGEIYEEDERGEKIRLLMPGKWFVRGDAEIEDMREALGVELPEGDYGTFNGLIYNVLDKVPEDGSRFTCEAYGMMIHVNSVKNHKITGAMIEVKKILSK